MSLSRKDKPLYLQIKNIIKDRILYGVYPLGTIIPSEPQLEKEFAVSKITVRNAISELAQEGYIEKGSGKGTKVIRNTSSSKLSKWKRFTEILVDEGYQLQKTWLRGGIIHNQEGTEPYDLFGERCINLERVYSLDNAPYIHYSHYLSVEVGDLELKDIDNGQSLYEFLEEQDILLDKLRDEFAVAVPPDDVETILQMHKGAPLLKRSRYSYDIAGKVIEYSVGYYNTQLQSYIVNYNM